MWSVGCILAELLGRKPIFPGKNFVHQLQLIFDVIGTPHTGEIERIKNKQARKFLDSIRGKVKVAFPQIIPSASEIATSALETLLLFSPSERATAAMLLGQPYLRDLSYAELPTEDPPAPHCDFSFERESLSPSQLRDKIVQEVSAFDVSPRKNGGVALSRQRGIARCLKPQLRQGVKEHPAAGAQGILAGTLQQTGVAFQSGIVESRQRPFHSDTSRAFRRCRPTIPRQVLTNECPDTHASAHTTHHKKSVPSPQKRRDTLENDPRQRLVSDRLSRGLPRPPQKSSKVCKNSAAKMS